MGFIATDETEVADKSAVAIREDMTRVESALTEFDKVSAGLADISARFPADLVYDVTTSKGMVEAIAHRAAWREPRLAVERLRKQAKAPVLALGKNIDARAAWLTEQLLIGEVPIDEQIKAEERRKEAEKQARIAAEFGRVQAIQDAIGEIHMDVMAASSKPSAAIAAAIEALRARTLDAATFQELVGQAEAARTAGLAKLEVALKAKLHDEAEAKRLADERAELAALRAAAAEQKKKDDAAAAVEQARVAEEQRVERERMAREQAEINRQRAELQEASRKAQEAQQPVETKDGATVNLQAAWAPPADKPAMSKPADTPKVDPWETFRTSDDYAQALQLTAGGDVDGALFAAFSAGLLAA